MIFGSKRTQALKTIERNIEKHGFHIYIVEQHSTPRFAYTIGLSKMLGAELLLAGAIAFDGQQVLAILHAMRDELKRGHSQPSRSLDQLSVRLTGLGTFSLRPVHASWSEALLRGAADYYQSTVSAYQIVPDDTHWTNDIPDASTPWSAADAPVWRWLHEAWPYDFPENATATTNLAALRGARITEVARWERDEWEMFAGPGPDVTEEDMRVVPVTSLVAIDPSLDRALKLEVGKALWRDEASGDWNIWSKSS